MIDEGCEGVDPSNMCRRNSRVAAILIFSQASGTGRGKDSRSCVRFEQSILAVDENRLGFVKHDQSALAVAHIYKLWA